VGCDQVIEMLGRSRDVAASTNGDAAPRATGSALVTLRAAWRTAANSGTRALAPGWAVICAAALRRSPSCRSRRLLGGLLKRVDGWSLWRPAWLMRIEAKW
jgi:hypothetical protein